MHDYKQLYLDFALGNLRGLRLPPRRVSLVLSPSCSGTYGGGVLAKFAILTKQDRGVQIQGSWKFES